ncbi:hypothetical protein FISHEDRAFT_54836 [Fistulina hepatica ATCC 64428]|uniref:Uncharacterized protein n=1 Tax=Fistulina hepatica ATCC 64428 TaxID=1128425 RepID=A0A0D7AQ22_9AGAR|nr:hypothetical protein FISHEDRAFT_54836 [Fistulina hepatica ATCC 64428]
MSQPQGSHSKESALNATTGKRARTPLSMLRYSTTLPQDSCEKGLYADRYLKSVNLKSTVVFSGGHTFSERQQTTKRTQLVSVDKAPQDHVEEFNSDSSVEFEKAYVQELSCCAELLVCAIQRRNHAIAFIKSAHNLRDAFESAERGGTLFRTATLLEPVTACACLRHEDGLYNLWVAVKKTIERCSKKPCQNRDEIAKRAKELTGTGIAQFIHPQLMEMGCAMIEASNGNAHTTFVDTRYTSVTSIVVAAMRLFNLFSENVDTTKIAISVSMKSPFWGHLRKVGPLDPIDSGRDPSCRDTAKERRPNEPHSYFRTGACSSLSQSLGLGNVDASGPNQILEWTETTTGRAYRDLKDHPGMQSVRAITAWCHRHLPSTELIGTDFSQLAEILPLWDFNGIVLSRQQIDQMKVCQYNLEAVDLQNFSDAHAEGNTDEMEQSMAGVTYPLLSVLNDAMRGVENAVFRELTVQLALSVPCVDAPSDWADYLIKRDIHTCFKKSMGRATTVRQPAGSQR